MNIHLPAILMFTRGIGFWPIPKLPWIILNFSCGATSRWVAPHPASPSGCRLRSLTVRRIASHWMSWKHGISVRKLWRKWVVGLLCPDLGKSKGGEIWGNHGFKYYDLFWLKLVSASCVGCWNPDPKPLNPGRRDRRSCDLHLHDLTTTSEISLWLFHRSYGSSISGWCFGTWILWLYHHIGNVIIPTDEVHHFSEG